MHLDYISFAWNQCIIFNSSWRFTNYLQYKFKLFKSVQEWDLKGVGQQTFILQAVELFGFRNFRTSLQYR